MESLEAYVYVLLGLNAGLRRGEALGLRWSRVLWGRDEDDPARALLIAEARPRGGEAGSKKSGRERKVALSSRLWYALRTLHRSLDEPPADALVSAGVPLAYVSHQLGHADVAVTGRHYARWTGGDQYRDPVRLVDGELPTDLIARLALQVTPDLAWSRNARYHLAALGILWLTLIGLLLRIGPLLEHAP